MRNKLFSFFAAFAALTVLPLTASADRAFTVRSIMPKIHHMEGSTVTVGGAVALSGTDLVLMEPGGTSGIAINVTLENVPESELIVVYERCDALANCLASISGTIIDNGPQGIFLAASRVVLTHGMN
jgi:hypothetical protein